MIALIQRENVERLRQSQRMVMPVVQRTEQAVQQDERPAPSGFFEMELHPVIEVIRMSDRSYAITRASVPLLIFFGWPDSSKYPRSFLLYCCPSAARRAI